MNVFSRAFEVTNDWTVSLTPQLFQRLSILKKIVKKDNSKFGVLGVSDEYLMASEEAIFTEIKKIAKELKKISKRRNAYSDYLGDLSFNTLDYLEGIIKAAADNNLVCWSDLGFQNKDGFNRHLENIKASIGKEFEKRFEKPWERKSPYSSLPYFEFNQQTGDGDEFYLDQIDESETEFASKAGSLEYLTVQLPYPENYPMLVSADSDDKYEQIEFFLRN